MNFKQNLKNIIAGIEYRYSYNNIYMFHHVTNYPLPEKSGCKLETEKFVKFITCLSSRDNICSIEELLTTYNKKAKKIAITFDDGVKDTFEVAYPILKKHNIPFTVFILSDCIGKDGYLTIEQIKELDADPIVTIGIHGSKHRILTKINEPEVIDEIHNSKKKVEKYLGHSFDLFAYSHGQYNDFIIEKIKKYNYRFAFAVKGRSILCIDRSNYKIPRISIENYNIDYWLDKLK